MNRQKYDTDLTDAEWSLFEKTMNEIRTTKRGRKPGIPRREVVNCILYRLRTGCQWRNLPHDFPAWGTVYRTYRRSQRLPIPENEILPYLDALQPHVRRPVLMVLLYGLRSTAICNIMPASIRNGYLTAIDKGEVTRRIPIDDTLTEIIEEANAHRATFPNPADRLFVNKAGLAWNHKSLLRAAQRFWEKAGLEKKKIHEVRHTLGTMAGKNFTVGMVQAAMGHRSRASSEVYFHPNEEMASTVRQKIVTKLYKNPDKSGKNEATPSIIIIDGDEEQGEYSCPCCSHKLLIVKEKERKP